MKYWIPILIIAIVFWVWMQRIHYKADTKPEPQATLLPTPATHHWVGKAGERRWVPVDEIGVVSNER